MKFNKNFIVLMLCFLAGAILPFAFAPFRMAYLSIVSLVLLAVYSNYPALSFDSFWNFKNKKASPISNQLSIPISIAIRYFLFGLGFFGVGISWIYISIHRFGNASIFLAGLLTFLLVGFFALLLALQGYCFSKLFPRQTILKWLIGFPIVWVAFEALRGWLFTGFPWLYLGYSQTDTPLGAFAPLIGCLGISYLVVFLAGLVISFSLTQSFKLKTLFLFIFALIFWIGFRLEKIEWTLPTETIKTVLIQGNIPQNLKWYPPMALPIISQYWATTQHHWDSRLIIWPEGAIPLPLESSNPLLRRFASEAKKRGTTIILGIPQSIHDHFYNAALVLGKDKGRYLKRHLVPFGEYIPAYLGLEAIAQFLGVNVSYFSAGPSIQPSITLDRHPIILSICYEIAYWSLFKDSLPQAQLIINLTDDAWFGKSIAAAQQLQIAQMRALETGRYVLCATNDGITAVINAKGQIIQTLPRFQPDVLAASVPFLSGSTPWVKMTSIFH